MGGGAAVAAAALAAGGGGDDGGGTPTTQGVTTTTTTTTTTLAAGPDARVRINGEGGGTFDCSSSLTFMLSVDNPTSQALRADSFELMLNAISGANCHSHRAPVDGTALRNDVPPQSVTEVRRFDLRGDLCLSNVGQPGCRWQALLSIVTSAGTLDDQIEFNTVP